MISVACDKKTIILAPETHSAAKPQPKLQVLQHDLLNKNFKEFTR
jgi:hypothetical protein